MHCRQLLDFPAFLVFPAERLVWRPKRHPYRLGPHGEPNRERLRSVGLSHYMIRIDDEKERVVSSTLAWTVVLVNNCSKFHSAFTPAASRIGFQRPSSAFWKAAKVAGFISSAVGKSWPSSSMRLRTAGSDKAVTAAALSLSMMSLELALGAHRP